MRSKRRVIGVAGCWLIAGGLLAANPLPAWAQVLTTWTGAGGDPYWSTPGNWDTGVVPCNDLDTYDVVIPGGSPVTFDVDTACVVTDLELGADATLTIWPGTSLDVLDDARIGGVVTSDNGTFTGNAPGADLTGSKSTLATTGGGVIALAATTYSSTGLGYRGSTYTLFSASGDTTLLDLSSLQSINAAFSDGQNTWTTVHRITATNNGSINLSGLQAVTTPAHSSDRLEFIISTGGTIDLSSLQSISGSGNVRFDIDVPLYGLSSLESIANAEFLMIAGSTLNLPAVISVSGGTYSVPQDATINLDIVESMSGVSLSLSDGATLNTPNMNSFTSSAVTLTPARTFNTAPLSDLNHSRITLHSGAQWGSFYGDLAATTYSSTGLNYRGSTYTLFSASDDATVLDLSSLQSINAGFNDGQTNWTTIQRITATNNGSIDLSELQAVTTPSHISDRLEFVISTGGSIDLSSLQSVSGGGNIRFDIDIPLYELPALESIANAEFLMIAGSILNLPAVISLSGGTYTIPADATMNLDALESISGVSLSLSDGATLNAPNMNSFTNSNVTLTPARTFNTPALTSLDNSAIAVHSGAQWGSFYGDLAATTYSSTGLSYRGSTYTLFSASDDTTVLDLSSLQSINAGFNDGQTNWTTIQRIAATNNASIDLSALQAVTTPSHISDRLEFVISTGGSIDLSSLQSVSGGGSIRFDLDVPLYELPVLESIANAEFLMIGGSTLNLPAVISLSGGTYAIPADATMNLLALESMSSVSLSLSDGATLNAPNMNSLTSSNVTLTPARTFNTGPLTSLNDSLIALNSGAQWGTFYGDVAATAYSSTGLSYRGSTYTLFSASDDATVLDLSSVQSINAGFNDGQTNWNTIQRITAGNNGLVDLSGLQAVTTPAHSSDRLEFQVSSGGVIDLSSLQSVTGSGLMRFDVYADGTLLAGDLTVTGNLRVNVADVTSVLDVAGSLYLGVGSQLAVAAGATLSIGEHLSFDYTDETAMDTQTAVVHFDGTGTQMLEVGGEDLWTLVDRDLPNFGFGQLVIGQDLGPTTVLLLDVIDNGNRPESDTEALYLYGLGGPQGLRILGGSTLVINNINVYTMIDGEWLHINTLFPPGVEAVAYDGGFIALHTVATAGNCTADMAVDLRDFGSLYGCLSGPDGDQADAACTCSDANHDGVVDMRDFAIVQQNFAEEPS